MYVQDVSFLAMIAALKLIVFHAMIHFYAMDNVS